MKVLVFGNPRSEIKDFFLQLKEENPDLKVIHNGKSYIKSILKELNIPGYLQGEPDPRFPAWIGWKIHHSRLVKISDMVILYPVGLFTSGHVRQMTHKHSKPIIDMCC